MKIEFDYNKQQVIQALRYHFISKMEMRIMIIAVNLFAVFSLVLYAMGKITPVAFLVNSVLWIILMVAVWYILPQSVYKRTETFKHRFTMYFNEDDFTLEHEKGRRNWPYKSLQSFKESPNFFHLYFDPRSFLLVPKNSFESQSQLSTLRSLLSKKTS